MENKKYTAQEVTGKRIKMIHMDDPEPIKPGTEGVIHGVDGVGQFMVKWDNGRTLSVCPELDKFEILNSEGHG
jgi:hypothetical protein